MASLFRMLFDTMPLACAEGAVYQRTGVSLDLQSMEMLRDYMRYVPDPSDWRVDPPTQADTQAIGSVGLHLGRTAVPIWGFDATKDCNSVSDITCRVESDEFKNYTVLQQLTFAHHVDGQLESSVEVQFGERHKFTLTLSERSRLASFLTTEGYNPPRRHRLWPLEAWEDWGLLHVHVFDLELITGNITLLADLPDGHRDKEEVDRFLRRCALFQDIPEDRAAGAVLFEDDLFRRFGSDIEALKVLDPAVVVGVGKDLAELRILTARVVVCCSTTFNRSLDDYVYGRATWMGRLYPHVMVRSTLPMSNVKAGVYFERPEKTTIEGHGICGCGEMNQDIDILLCADNNSGNTGELAGEALPFPLWSHIFNYAVPSAHDKLGSDRIRVVKRAKHVPSVTRRISGLVEREGAPGDVALVTGQGAFDNIHVAPSMKLPPITSAETLVQHHIAIDPASRSKWMVDDIRMAPFCAHDCFHLHWRWMNVWSDPYLCGWDGHTPNIAPGAPMVPENQDVYLRLVSAFQFVYEVEAGLSAAGSPMDPDRWQIICHHGSAYALGVTEKATMARAAGEAGAFDTDWASFNEHGVGSSNSWACFYWNLRYHLDRKTKLPFERLHIPDIGQLMLGVG